MSQTELRTWAGLAATAAIFAFWLMRMTSGWQVVEQPAATVFGTIVAVTVLMIIAHSLIAGTIAAFGAAFGAISSDERDLIIEARAERWGGFVVSALVVTMALHVTGESAFPTPWLPAGLVPFDSATGFVFLMISVVFVGEIATGLIKGLSYRLGWGG
jgi:hypothetical protein